jgi:hypothetical protein
MIDVRVLRGVPGDEDVASIVELYGPADAKYRDPRFVRHQFAGNPYGWTLHAFAEEDGRAVGHCALLPLPARTGAGTMVSGKFEAFAVRPDRRSSTLADGRLVGLGLLAELYAHAEEAGFAVLHDLAQPELGLMHRLHGAARVPVPWRSFVGVGDPRTLRTLRRDRAVAAAGLALVQRTLQLPARAAAPRPVVRPIAADDPPPPVPDLEPGAWTLAAADMWDWLVGSDLLAWVHEPDGARALVRVPGPAAQAAELLDWQPGTGGLAPAIATVAAIARLGRTGRSVRIGDFGVDLRRAARLLGLVPAREPLMLYVKSMRADVDARAAVPTPYFFATF